jgi:hypothetical protein
MTRFILPATCVQCAGALTLVNSTASGLLSVAILECEPCRRQWEVCIRITVHRTPEQVRMAEKRAGSRQRARERVGV